jgi:tetratricopeptide (TPR) repeat protein
VFDRVLSQPVDRYNEYVRILSHLNLAFSTDRSAFRGLLRAKALHELFPNYEDVKEIFAVAEKAGPHEAFLYHQRANYERIRADGNIMLAEQLLQKARELDPRDMTILHTMAELKRVRADRSTHARERERFRNDARGLLASLLADSQNARYARVTLVKIALDDLRDVLEREESSDKEVDESIRAVESHLERGQQQFPDEQFLHTAEADFGQLLQDYDRSFSALERAFNANARDPYIASRFAKLLENRGDLDGAEAVLTTALEANRGDKQLHFQYGNVLRHRGDKSISVLVYHFQRAFTKWDTNYEAQFWFARYAFESEDPRQRDESKAVFRHLREVPIAPAARREIRDVSMAWNSWTRFHGRLVRKEFAHGFIERDGTGDWVFCHKHQSERWDTLRVGERVAFAIGFSFGGAIALEVQGL